MSVLAYSPRDCQALVHSATPSAFLRCMLDFMCCVSAAQPRSMYIANVWNGTDGGISSLVSLLSSVLYMLPKMLLVTQHMRRIAASWC